jgi:hypothetical protein
MKEMNCHFTFESIVLLRKIVGSRLQEAGKLSISILNSLPMTAPYTFNSAGDSAKRLKYKEHTYHKNVSCEIDNYK